MNTKKYLISTIILWILVICLLIVPFKESIGSYYNGTNIALEGVEIIYGMEAFFSTLSLYISFYFPIFIIGIVLLLISIILTTMTIIKYKKKI